MRSSSFLWTKETAVGPGDYLFSLAFHLEIYLSLLSVSFSQNIRRNLQYNRITGDKFKQKLTVSKIYLLLVK